jgi:energy-converting hydrogenase Eha subunit B
MKVVQVQIELVINDDVTDKQDIAVYLTDRLYSDPEFFGDFGSENIVSIVEFD